MKLEDRVKLAQALGADSDLAEDVGPVAVGDDPDYRAGGGDALVYQVDLSALKGTPLTYLEISGTQVADLSPLKTRGAV